MSSLSFTAKKSVVLDKLACGALVVPVIQDTDASSMSADLDEQLQTAIAQALALKDIEGKVGQHMWLLGSGKIDRVLLVGVGKADDRDDDADAIIAKTIATQLTASKAKDATLLGATLDQVIDGLSAWLETLARDLVMASYRYTATLSKPKPKSALAKFVCISGDAITAPAAKAALTAGAAIGASAGT